MRIVMKLVTGAITLLAIYSVARVIVLPSLRRALDARRREKLAADRYERIIEGTAEGQRCVLCERPDPDCLDKKNGTRFHENCLTALMKG